MSFIDLVTENFQTKNRSFVILRFCYLYHRVNVYEYVTRIKRKQKGPILDSRYVRLCSETTIVHKFLFYFVLVLNCLFCHSRIYITKVCVDVGWLVVQIYFNIYSIPLYNNYLF